MDAVVQKSAWWSQAVLIGAVVAAVMLPLGALGSRMGLWGFSTGFLFLGGAALLSVMGVILGLVGFFLSRKPGASSNRMPLMIGTVVCAAILAMLGAQFNTARTVPAIHNISTDTIEPPQFDVVVALRGEDSNPLTYDAETLAPLQRSAYPWVVPLELPGAPDVVFDAALEVLSKQGLEIVNADRDTGTIEAVATTFWFGFKDDVVVRVRPLGSGARVDVRSVSRVGQSDLGANAARIGAILDGLR
ncbi:MAG: DUF1499 domain-containing protein [Gammaproteobacteria bacterium]|nr:DUF1499 domain-containing protein [Gammaproteobacteria bacterium]